MKHHIQITLGMLAASMAVASASQPFVDGNIAVAFYTVSATNVVGPNIYVVNLGPGSLYRENTQNNVPVTTINSSLASATIGTDLSTVFGANWANAGTLYWAVVGGVPQLGSVTNGDPARTSYLSRARTSYSTRAVGPNSSISNVSSTNRGTLATNIEGFLFTGTNEAINLLNGNTSTSGSNPAGVILPKSNSRSLDEYLPPTVLTYFGIGIDPRQILASGTIAGGAGVEGALDVYRIIHTTSGADLTAGASSGNASAGVGQFIGTLTLDGSGNLRFGANPDSDNDGMADAWEVTRFGSIAQGAASDFDHDGTDNLTEYLLDLDPSSGSSAFSATRAANGQISWPSVTGVSFKVFRSTTLQTGSWSEIATVEGTAGTATYTDPAPPAGTAFYQIALP